MANEGRRPEILKHQSEREMEKQKKTRDGEAAKDCRKKTRDGGEEVEEECRM